MHRFIKAVGSGQKRARNLTRDEACAAMSLLCDGVAQPEQVGAFLLALRMKGEAAEEMAGFVDAIEARMETGGARAPDGTLDVDCHGDGHKGRATLLPAAACALAALGVPVLLRLQRELPTARHGLIGALSALGLDVTRPLDAARATAALGATRVAAIDLRRYAAPLDRMVGLRPLFGVRTVAQTLMKLVDPLGCEARAVGVFHAPYLPSTAGALAALGRRGLCVQALGGLPEASPGKILRVCRAGGSPETIDLRALAAVAADDDASDDDEEDSTVPAAEDAAALNQAALDGAPAAMARAAAAAAILLHAARAIDPLTAAADAQRVLASGEARAVAARLRDA
jgi:anthranilate phosphoribosyltransferase